MITMVWMMPGKEPTGFDPANREDRNIKMKSGYTALEVYLNSLVGEMIPIKKITQKKK